MEHQGKTPELPTCFPIHQRLIEYPLCSDLHGKTDIFQCKYQPIAQLERFDKILMSTVSRNLRCKPQETKVFGGSASCLHLVLSHTAGLASFTFAKVFVLGPRTTKVPISTLSEKGWTVVTTDRHFRKAFQGEELSGPWSHSDLGSNVGFEMHWLFNKLLWTVGNLLNVESCFPDL